MHMEERLKRALIGENGVLFWTICSHPMTSPTYIVLTMREVYPVWYKGKDYSYILKLCKEVKNLSLELYPYPDMVSQWVPKPHKPGSLRPLGIPLPPWRVWLRMFNKLLVFYLNHRIKGNRHGFRPGLATGTAWQYILTKGLEYKYIYEWDLSEYFETVSIRVLLQELSGGEVYHQEFWK